MSQKQLLPGTAIGIENPNQDPRRACQPGSFPDHACRKSTVAISGVAKARSFRVFCKASPLASADENVSSGERMGTVLLNEQLKSIGPWTRLTEPSNGSGASTCSCHRRPSDWATVSARATCPSEPTHFGLSVCYDSSFKGCG